jgi:Mn2+/Fe2+ NRAMP family transporter
MMHTLRHWRHRILFTLAIIGPGIITAFADNDAAGVATYSISAATYGYRILIIIIPMIIVLAVTQEIGARLAIVAQKGLGDLIRERMGIRIAIAMYTLLFLVNMAIVIQNIGGIKEALLLFGISPLILPLIVGGLFFFVVSTQYRTIERFFFLLILFYSAYILSAWQAQPDWGAALRALVIPQGHYDRNFLFTSIAVVGATVTAWGQFFISSYAKDKRLTMEHLTYNRFEVYLGAFLTNAFSFFLMVAVSATLFVNGITITGASDAATAMVPFAGAMAGILFGAGLLTAGLLGCIIVPLTTAYAFSEFFGYSGSLDEDFQKSRLFYTTLLIQLILGTCIVLLPGVSLFNITLVANFANGMILPVLFYFLYRFANNERIMGEHKNTPVQNWLLILSAVCITAGSLVVLIQQVQNLL